MDADLTTRSSEVRPRAGGPIRDFLQSLRLRMQHLAPETPLPVEPASRLREVACEENVIVRFLASAETAGCQVHRSTDQDWHTVICGIVQGQAARKIIVEPQPGTALTRARADQLHQMLAANGVASAEERDDEALFTADAAVTGVWSAIAETGTLVCVAGPHAARGTSLIPPVHIALVAEAQVVADLFDAFEQLCAAERFPSHVNLITGPSKTADIEGVLVTGVHGPGAVHIVVLQRS